MFITNGKTSQIFNVYLNVNTFENRVKAKIEVKCYPDCFCPTETHNTAYSNTHGSMMR